MPTYKVTDPSTGNTLNLTGDSPPTEAELEHIFSQNQAPKQSSFDMSPAAINAYYAASTKAANDAANAPSTAPYLIAGMVVLAVVALILLRKLIQSRPWRTIPGAVRSTVKMKDKMAFDLSDEDGEWFAAAEEEITTGNFEKATWSRALVKAGGNEDKRKAEYILLRVKKLRISKVAEAVEWAP
jgi:hypothetical protein